MKKVLPFIAPLIFIASTLAAQSAITVESIKTINVSAFTAEIVQYCKSENLLAVTNPHWKTLDLYQLDDPANPKLIEFDYDDELPGNQGPFTVYEPTSVAIHPQLPVAFVAVLSRQIGEPGRVIAFDLRASSRGKWLLNQTVGQHPDSIAISPDGKYAIIACEAEGHPETEASIQLIDLTSFDLNRTAADPDLPLLTLADLDKHLGRPLGIIEPEFVAIDPQSRFAAVTCQENDAVVLVNLQGKPQIAIASALSINSGPDGLDIIDNVLHPNNPNRIGCLIAIAEEGNFDKLGNLGGQSCQLIWVDPNNLNHDPVFLKRIDIRPDISAKKPTKRREPEAVKLARLGSRMIAVVAAERGDCLVVYDITNPLAPVFIAKAEVGDRPEGLTLHRINDHSLIAITGDEGKYGPGTISFVRISANP
ncbi:hypothetical protein JD969_07080 [Planctomycetota bacterium]|nr:hypothetical protein JD969_07080 [Planctomycetota bacterium]